MSQTEDTIPGLKALLSRSMLSTDFDPESAQRERFQIEHLAGQVREWEVGGISYEELKAAFDQADTGDFDLLRWIQSKADEGIYDMPEEEIPNE